MKKTTIYNCCMIICLILSLSPLQGCKMTATHPTLVESSLPPMVRLKDLFFDVTPKTCFKVSPDGKKIAWLGEKNRKTVIFFKTIGSDDIKHCRHNFLKGTIHFSRFYWARDNRHILYSLWEEFSDQMHVFAVDTQNHTKVARNLTPDKESSYRIHQILKNDPAHILVKKYGSAETITKTSTIELVKLNILTVKKKNPVSRPSNQEDWNMTREAEHVPAITEHLTSNPGNVYSWITDLEGKLRARIVLDSNTKRSLQIVDTDKGTWHKVLNWTIDDTVKFVGFSNNNQSIYLRSNAGRDRISLVALDIKTKQQELVAENPTSDIENVLFWRHSGKPVAAIAYPDYQKIQLLDPDYRDILQAFSGDEKRSIHIVSIDDDQRLMTVNVTTSTNVHRFLYDRITKNKELLATRFSPEYEQRLSTMKHISFKSRDGLLINGYLTIPAGTTGKHLPMVLKVHGGPWSRDYWGMNRVVQLLANRGYAVLQINYRGSSGYGRSFMTAARGEFAAKMHMDLIDGVNWAVDQGIADPKKIAVYGYSFGGYAALVGLSFTPEVFSCGVDVNGIANLETFINSKDIKDNDYSVWYKWRTYVGNPENHKELEIIKAKSPYHHVDKITKPLLIIQGAQDQRVPRSEADAMVKILKSSNKEVKYILFPNESHYIMWWNNRYTMYNSIEKFLAQHLGGRKIHSDSIR